MKFCSNCGTGYQDDVKFCANCGNPMNAQTQGEHQPNPGYHQPNPDYHQPYGQPQSGTYQQSYGTPVQMPPPMNWFKFLIYFALFASAVLNVASAVTLFAGTQYTYNGYNLSKEIYAAFEGLQATDIFYAFALLGIAALAIVVRMKLAGYKADGPKFISIFYAASAAVGLLYAIIATVVITSSPLGATTFDTSSFLVSAIGSVIGSGIMIAVNMAYFKKRAHLFNR